MKIFTNNEDEYQEKVNFVDEYNVFVGYDMGQDCCEHAYWFISKTEDNCPAGGHGITQGLEEYNFDKSYFVEVEPKKEGDDEYKISCLEDGGMVRFKLIAGDKPDLFLHLYNAHNGYYGHGFEMRIGAEVVHHGSL